jgi:hypothetical protein
VDRLDTAKHNVFLCRVSFKSSRVLTDWNIEQTPNLVGVLLNQFLSMLENQNPTRVFLYSESGKLCNYKAFS